jgi:hypothetical protein
MLTDPCVNLQGVVIEQLPISLAYWKYGGPYWKED